MKFRSFSRVCAPLTPLVLSIGLLFAQAPARAQVQLSLGLAVPGLSIGINVPSYPRLVRVPGYPVYYDAQAESNYFFYDGLYWVFRDDGWYQSSWYDGPWRLTPNDSVPLFVLRVPVRYYRQPPAFFSGWRGDAAPRWGQHWGAGWASQHQNWDRWDHQRMPAIAPLPSYQRRYSGESYPRAPEQQAQLHGQNYRYQTPQAPSPQAQSQPPHPPQRQQQHPEQQQHPQQQQQQQQQHQPEAQQQPPRAQPGVGENRGHPGAPERGPERSPDRAPQRGPEHGPGDRGQEGAGNRSEREHR